MLVSGGHSSLLRVDRRDRRRRAAGRDHRRRGGGGLRQGRPAARAAVPRRSAHRPGGARRGRGGRRLPARADRARRDLERHRFDFSFSGLKTAVARWVEARERAGEPVPVADVAASFQEAVCDVLVRKALDAATSQGIEDILIGGGVAANSRLRAMAEERAAAVGIRVRVPRPGLCTDNGAMVAALGAELVARGPHPSALDLPADSSQPITTVVA